MDKPEKHPMPFHFHGGYDGPYDLCAGSGGTLGLQPDGLSCFDSQEWLWKGKVITDRHFSLLLIL